MGFYVLEDFSWSFSGPFCSLGFVLACAEGLGLGVVAGIAVGCAETDETSDGTSVMLWSGPSLGLVSSEMSADSTDTDVASDVTGVTIVSGPSHGLRLLIDVGWSEVSAVVMLADCSATGVGADFTGVSSDFLEVHIAMISTACAATDVRSDLR